MGKRILIINGPNLNLVGDREEAFYGKKSFDDFLPELSAYADKNGGEIEYFQSNHEGEIIDIMHKSIGNIDGIILNPGALTHYSYSIHDAVLAVRVPVIEVHISNIYNRDAFRSKSIISPAATGILSGFGLSGYMMALDYLIKKM